nr:hypothetical protein [uncultured Duganella sp.]
MTHETTLAMAELKRELISANKTDALRKHSDDPTDGAAFSDGIETGPTWVVLADGKFMDGVLYRRVKRDVLARIPSLSVGQFLQIKKICSLEFWDSLENADRQRAGRCLAHLVSKKEVGLALGSLNETGPKLYCKT